MSQKQREDLAATTIQDWWVRANDERLRRLAEDVAATTVQAVWRGRVAREAVAAMAVARAEQHVVSRMLVCHMQWARCGRIRTREILCVLFYGVLYSFRVIPHPLPLLSPLPAACISQPDLVYSPSCCTVDDEKGGDKNPGPGSRPRTARHVPDAQEIGLRAPGVGAGAVAAAMVLSLPVSGMCVHWA